VAETFLRCVKERFAEDNVVIELNALKIAEDRSFADCARYILTTLLQLCLPAPAWVSPEYVSLFPADVPDSGAKEGKLQLLTRFKKQLNKWQPLLRRFLTSEDDQVGLTGLGIKGALSVLEAAWVCWGRWFWCVRGCCDVRAA
jgi:translation initiation factor eIF-2B subunit epsilon